MNSKVKNKYQQNCFLKIKYFKKYKYQPELIFQIYDLSHDIKVTSLKANLKKTKKQDS
jgi:hypothetical protein